MRSEIVGEFEKIVQPTVEKLRTPGLVGMGIALNADAAVATANTIERLAQELDRHQAQSLYALQWRRVGWGLLVFFVALHWLVNHVN